MCVGGGQRTGVWCFHVRALVVVRCMMVMVVVAIVGAIRHGEGSGSISARNRDGVDGRG